MFKSISNFLRRHRRKILITGGLVTALYFIKRFGQRKFLEWESKQTHTYLEQLKKHHYFDGTMQTCDGTVLSLSTKVTETIAKILNIENLLAELKSNPANKVKLWEDIKVHIFSQALGEVVCECLLVVFLRVQLSILGGYMYVDSQKALDNTNSLAEPSDCSLASPNVQSKYLGQLNKFFVDGIPEIMKPVIASVEAVIGELSLSSTIKLSQFEKILDSIKTKLFASELFQANFLTQCFLGQEIGDHNEPSCSQDFIFYKMINETKDILDCHDFEKTISACMDKGMIKILDMLTESFCNVSKNAGTFINPNDIEAPFAKILPVLRAVLIKQKPQDPGAYVQQLLQLDMVKNFSANIFESFSQPSCDHVI